MKKLREEIRSYPSSFKEINLKKLATSGPLQLDTLAGSRIGTVCGYTGSPSHPIDGYRSQRRLKHHTTRTNHPSAFNRVWTTDRGTSVRQTRKKAPVLGWRIAYCAAGFGAALSTNRGDYFFRVIQGFGAAAGRNVPINRGRFLWP